MTAPSPPPGFYPDPNGLPCQREWDGTRWTDNTAPLVTGPAPMPAPPQWGEGQVPLAAPPAEQSFRTAKSSSKKGNPVVGFVVLIVAVLVVVGIIKSSTGSSNPYPGVAPAQSIDLSKQAPVEATAAPTPTISLELANAIQSARGYLNQGGGFSKAGLIDQLDSAAGENYPTAVATEAVNSLNVDWNAQAVLSAKGYLKNGSFSCQDLVSQLDSAAGEKFTVAQAEYAAHDVGLC